MNQPADPLRSATRHRRYTGPELGALLAKVREELGVEASIVEANRVRTGGVAGFFARESYELVAAGAETAEDQPVRPGPVSRPLRVSASSPPVPPAGRARGVSMALLERAEAVSAHERSVLRQRAAADPYDLRDRPAEARFAEVLEAQLNDPTVIDTDPDADKAPPPAGIDVTDRDQPAALLDAEPAIITNPAPTTEPQPITATEPMPAAAPATTEPATMANQVLGGARAGREGPILAVVGELETALDLGERLAVEGGDERNELVVLSPNEAATTLVAAHPAGSVGQHYEQVSNRLFAWIGHQRRGIAVIDAALGDRLVGEVRCLTALCAGTVHVAARSAAEAVRLLGLLDGYDGRVVVDLIEPDG